MRTGSTQRGFTYLGLLAAVAVLGIGLAAASELWSTTAKRQKLSQLQWTQAQYALAIQSYRESSPGTVKRNPTDLRELLDDRRHLATRRHLRQLYVNPMTGAMDWELTRDSSGGITAVIHR